MRLIVVLFLIYGAFGQSQPDTVQSDGYLYLRVAPKGSQSAWSWEIDNTSWVPPSALQTGGLFVSGFHNAGANGVAVAIFNPTPSAIELSMYSLRRFSRPSGLWSTATMIQLNGSIPSLSILVVSSSTYGLGVVSTVLDQFLSNDAIGLFIGSVLVDSIGDESPVESTGYVIGNVSDALSASNYLRRVASVSQGNPNWPSAIAEWEVFPAADSTILADLKTHTFTPTSTVYPLPTLTSSSPGIYLVAGFIPLELGVYNVSCRVKFVGDAPELNSLTLSLFGSSSTTTSMIAQFPAEDQLKFLNFSGKNVWYESNVGVVSVLKPSKVWYTLMDPGMFQSLSYRGYRFDWCRAQKISGVDSIPTLELLTPFDGQVLQVDTLTVTYQVKNNVNPVASSTILLDGLPLVNGRSTVLNTEPFVLRQLTPGSHRITVNVLDVAGELIATSTKTVVVNLPPPAINAVNVLSVSTNALSLSWLDSSNDPNVSFKVQIRTQNDDGSLSGWRELGVEAAGSLKRDPTNGFVANFENLICATTYHISVASVNVLGQGEWSSVAVRTKGVIRKNGALVSEAERNRWVSSLISLNKKGEYQKFTYIHMGAFNMRSCSTCRSNAAHRGPVFLPWHRRFLFELESALQKESGDPNQGLLYWNWAEADPTSTRLNSPLFAANFMGGDGTKSKSNRVFTGPFATCASTFNCKSNWTTILSQEPQSVDPLGLQRQYGVNLAGNRLGSAQQIADLINSNLTYDAPPYDDSANNGFRNRLENFHNLGHVWVGGCMLYGTSPNDPLFYMNHVFVDKIWEGWQAKNPNQVYQPTGVVYPKYHVGSEPMWPWDNSNAARKGIIVRPVDMWDSNLLGVRYASENWKPEWDEINKPKPDYVNFKNGLPPTHSLIGKFQSPSEVTAASTFKVRSYAEYVFTAELTGDADVNLILSATSGVIRSVLVVASSTAKNLSVSFSVQSSHRFLNEPISINLKATAGSFEVSRVWFQSRDVKPVITTANAIVASALVENCAANSVDAEIAAPTQAPSSSSPSSSPSSSSSSDTGVIVGAVLGSVGGLVLMILVGVFSYKAGQRSGSGNHHIMMK